MNDAGADHPDGPAVLQWPDTVWVACIRQRHRQTHDLREQRTAMPFMVMPGTRLPGRSEPRCPDPGFSSMLPARFVV